MLDVTGREALKIENIRGKTTAVPAGNLPAGMYFYRIMNGKTLIGAGKIIVNQ